MNAPVANPEPKPAYASPKPTVSAPPKRSPIWTVVEWFELIMVVAAGVLIGTVAAYLIALFSGWIDIGC